MTHGEPLFTAGSAVLRRPLARLDFSRLRTFGYAFTDAARGTYCRFCTRLGSAKRRLFSYALAGCGVLGLLGGCGGVIAGVPVLGCYCGAPLIGAVTPAILAVVETFVGETFGTQRGALLWPILAAYAAEVLVVLLVPLVGALLTLAGTIIAPAVVYGLTAEDKRPGDDELRLPGLLFPNHPDESAPQEVRAPSEGPAVAGVVPY